MSMRFALHLPHEQIQQGPTHVRLPTVEKWIDHDKFKPKYNIAPSDIAPVIFQSRGRISRSCLDHNMRSMKWGLIFAKGGKAYKNARSESLIGGRWMGIKDIQRCVVICHGYYAWLNRESVLLPYLVKHTSDDFILLAGLYNAVRVKADPSVLWTFAIVTTEANADLTQLQDRHPVVLSTQHAVDTWLDTTTQHWTPDSSLTRFIQQYKESTLPLQWYRVPKEVGPTKHESPSFILPIENREDGIVAAFQRQEEIAVVDSQTQRWDSHRLPLRAVPPSQPPAVINISEDDDELKPEPESAQVLAESSQHTSQRGDETVNIPSTSSSNPAATQSTRRRPERTPRKPKVPKGHGCAKIDKCFALAK